MINKAKPQNLTTNSPLAKNKDKDKDKDKEESLHGKPKVIILGASNVARGLSSVVQTAQLIISKPIDFYMAIGHGRSYGQWSKVFGRTLPGINECAIWEALSESNNHDTRVSDYALITDIGNDIPYGADIQQILDWVKLCVDKLQNEHDVQNIILTSLPVDSLATLTKTRFNIIRALLFPRSPITFASAIKNSTELNNELIRYATQENPAITFVPLSGRWYGLDPIHIRVKHWKQAWPEILLNWLHPNDNDPVKKFNNVKPKNRPINWLYLRFLVPHYRRIYGIEQKQIQPSGHLRDGSTISMF